VHAPRVSAAICHVNSTSYEDLRVERDRPSSFPVKPFSGTFVAATSEPLVVLTSDWGSIAMGLVAYDVLFLCFVGEISEELGARCARRIERTLAEDRKVGLFMDAYSPDGGNAAARAHVVRALLARRDRIHSVVTLVRTEHVMTTARRLSDALAVPAVVTTDSAEFDRMLVEVAPLAHERIHPDNCVVASPESERPLRIVGSA
jgi:hypothetical protein